LKSSDKFSTSVWLGREPNQATATRQNERDVALEPEWQQSASITPQQASTRNGMVRAILEPKTTGAIRVMARVENVTQAVVITVSNPGTSGSSSEDAGRVLAPMTHLVL
jgi:hypothetical protein